MGFRLDFGTVVLESPRGPLHRYGYGALKCHMSRPVAPSMARDTAHSTGTNPNISAPVSRRLSDAAANPPNANARTTVLRTKPGLMIDTSITRSNIYEKVCQPDDCPRTEARRSTCRSAAVP